MYYNQCAFCGANLDPGEKCDCQKEILKLKNTDAIKSTAEQSETHKIKLV